MSELGRGWRMVGGRTARVSVPYEDRTGLTTN